MPDTKGTILIVDDTPANLQLLESILQERGYGVRAAISGRMALNAVRHNLPDIILLDINMPEMNGFEVCRALKSEPDLAAIPVIFVSAAVDTADKLRAFEEGGVDYVTKPFQPLEVLARVETHLTLAKTRLELSRARERAEEADRIKSAFLATMSHELRTPLNSIIGFTGTLLQGLAGPINEEQAKQLALVKESASHLLFLISDVLDISKIEAGQLTVAQAPFNLKELIEKVALSVQPLAEKNGLALSIEVAKEMDTPIVGDSRRVEQILLNLLSNAIKFTEKGKVSVRCLRSGDDCLTTVSDTGIGIGEENLAGLFTPFHQIDSGLRPTYEGTGLGLSISKRLVELLGGSMLVESTLGKGSTFGFSLPLDARGNCMTRPECTAQPNEKPRTTAEYAEASGRQHQHNSFTRDRVVCAGEKGKRTQSILIVDDMPNNIHLLKVLLHGNGYEVQSAANGAEALKAARANPPDLVISDILMPVMDGYVLCREWRADARLRHIPFLFFTATFTEQKDEALALSIGADRFVIKPQEPEVLMGIIREMLDSSRPATPLAAAASTDEKELLRGYGEALFRKLEHKMAELERVNCDLVESEDNFRRFIMECPIPIAVANEDNEVVLLNDRFVNTFGYTVPDLPTVGAWWERAYPDPAYRIHVQGEWQAAIETAPRSGEIVHTSDEYRIQCKDNTERFVQVYAAIISKRLLVVFNDVTERKLSEKERATLQTQMIQQDKMASLGQLAAGVAHEINNPIGFITSNLQSLSNYATKLKNYIDTMDHMLLADSTSTTAEVLAGERSRLKIDFVLGDIDSLLEECMEGTQRIAHIVQNLRVFAHNDTIEAKAVDLNSCCDSIIRIIWNEIKYVATLKREYGDIPPVVCNPQQIGQVVMNLLINAAQAMNEQGVITLKTWAEGDAAYLSVADTGCGIASGDMEKVFEAFFTTKEIGKGTGLGLSISAEIVRNHGGEITVESEIGHGTTFTIRLPIQGGI